jgi:hypothetical protein
MAWQVPQPLTGSRLTVAKYDNQAATESDGGSQQQDRENHIVYDGLDLGDKVGQRGISTDSRGREHGRIRLPGCWCGDGCGSRGRCGWRGGCPGWVWRGSGPDRMRDLQRQTGRAHVARRVCRAEQDGVIATAQEAGIPNIGPATVRVERERLPGVPSICRDLRRDRPCPTIRGQTVECDPPMHALTTVWK